MKKSDYEKYFKGKRITVMGLGLLGRGIQVTEFLAECGAILTVTDLKTKNELATSLKKLSKYKIRYVLGKHELKDFENVDIAVKAAGVPLNSEFINHARDNGVEISMDASLFAKIAKGVRIVGVTGTRGKSMTTSAIYHVLKSNEDKLKCKVYVGGNLRGMATLPLLKKVKVSDIVVLELDSWQCQGFGDEKISPEVSVFTSFMPDHMNYYHGDMKKYFGDKANIFKYQNKSGALVIRPKMKEWIKKSDTKGKLIVANKKSLAGVKLKVIGEHQMENMSCAYEVAKLFGLKDTIIKKSLATFGGLEGRMQFLREIKGVKIYNDNNATTPEATTAGLEAVGGKRVILIAGGNDKNIPLDGLIKGIKKFTKAVYLIPGNGTDRLATLCLEKKIPVFLVRNLKHGVHESMHVAKKGDTILFSPAFTSFGLYKNEYERNDEFIKLIKNL
jgi:UDP-N-acetylmuramoylalanine--D-glutamate ligase